MEEPRDAWALAVQDKLAWALAARSFGDGVVLPQVWQDQELLVHSSRGVITKDYDALERLGNREWVAKALLHYYHASENWGCLVLDPAETVSRLEGDLTYLAFCDEELEEMSGEYPYMDIIEEMNECVLDDFLRPDMEEHMRESCEEFFRLYRLFEEAEGYRRPASLICFRSSLLPYFYHCPDSFFLGHEQEVDKLINRINRLALNCNRYEVFGMDGTDTYLFLLYESRALPMHLITAGKEIDEQIYRLDGLVPFLPEKRG